MKFGSRHTEVSVERTHSHMKNPIWTCFIVSYYNSRIVFVLFLGRSYAGGHARRHQYDASSQFLVFNFPVPVPSPSSHSLHMPVGYDMVPS